VRHLITGGGGFIGSALANRLVSEGHDVVAFDRFSRGKESRLDPRVEIRKGDIRRPTDVADAVVECDAVWHLAYIQGTQTFYADPCEVIEVALRGIVNVLDVSEGRDFFLVSSSEVYQEPPQGMYPTDETVPLVVPDVTNPRYSYGGGKIASEIATLAHADRLNRAVIVRPHNIYGPDMGTDHVIPEFVLRMQETGPDFPIQGTGRETRSFCYIDDCIDGLLTLYDKGAHRSVYHLGNPYEEWSIGGLAELIGEKLGRKVRVAPGTLPKGSPTRRLPDIGKMRGLGYKPRVDLFTGLESTVEWYVRNR
jgi:nucleoside-diphosphate-sugar epimerase